MRAYHIMRAHHIEKDGQRRLAETPEPAAGGAAEA